MTLGQLWSAVSNRVGNLDSAVSADQSRITTWANEAVVNVLRRTKCYVTSATVALTSGQGDYTLDTDILVSVNVSLTAQGVSWPLERVSADELLGLRHQNASSSSPVQYYALNGANLLMVHPIPSSADTLTFYYVPRPTAMSLSTHDPADATYGGVPSEYHKALEYYACAEAADDDDDQSSAQGQRYRELYERELSRLVSAVRWKFGPYNPRARINPYRRSQRRNDNSVYP